MTTTRTPAANRFQPIDPQPDDPPPMLNQTEKTLARIRTELLTTFSAVDWVLYSHLVGWLRDTDVASRALKVGDTAPDFLLPDADGHLHSSEQLRRNGPLVLSFVRGGWCGSGLVRGEVGEDRDQFGRVAAPRVVDADVGVLDHPAGRHDVSGWHGQRPARIAIEGREIHAAALLDGTQFVGDLPA